MVPIRDHTDDGEVVGRGLHLVLQQEVWLLIEKAVFGEDHTPDLCQKILLWREKLQVLRHPAGNRVLRHRPLKGLRLGGMDIGEGERRQADLCGAPAIERTVVGQGVLSHHPDQRAAEDQHHIAVLQKFVPRILQDRGEGRICLDQVGKLVQDQHFLFLRPVPDNLLKQVQPVRKGHSA